MRCRFFIIILMLGVLFDASRSASAQVLSLADAELTVYGQGSFFGNSMAGIGDVNDDGFDDFAIGAFTLSSGGFDSNGRLYVIFGAAGAPQIIDLAAAPAGRLMTIDGNEDFELIGLSVTGLGDFNGDSIDDFALGSSGLDPLGRLDAGVVYVIYGSASLVAGSFDLSTMTSIQGLQVYGGFSFDNFGSRVAPAGDFNADGRPDLMASAFSSDYVVYGSSTLPAVIDLGGALTGVAIAFAGPDSSAGDTLSGIGDFNGDTIDDIAISVPRDDVAATDDGRTFVVFGSATPPVAASLTNLAAAGLSGIELRGAAVGDELGHSTSGAGDINNDGFDDLLVSSVLSQRGGFADLGEAYLVYGGASVPAILQMSSLAPHGVVIRGGIVGGKLGRSTTGAGDINNDGIDDFVVGASVFLGNGAALLFHGGQALPDLITGSDLFVYATVYEGPDPSGVAGWRVARAGDLNGDSGRDFLVSALFGSPPGFPLGGEVYAVFGATVPAVSDFTCAMTGTAVNLSWQNPVTYDSLEVTDNGNLIATLSGTATSLSIPRAGAGTHTYAVTGLVSGTASAAATCIVNVLVNPPTSLDCGSDGSSVTLTWTNGQTYSGGIEVLRGGLLVATLPGAVISFAEASPGTGIYEYCVRGVNGLDRSTDTCCIVTIPLSPTAFECEADGDSVLLTWQNAELYDELHIFRDGNFIVSRPGTATSFTELGVPQGPHIYALFGVIDGDLSAAATCSVSVPERVENLTCSVSGDTATIEWTNPVPFSAVRIERDGVQVALLAGTATSFMDPGLAIGTFEYEVSSQIGAVFAARVSCQVQVLEPVQLSCSAVDGEVFLSWLNGNGGSYEFIDVRRDAVLLATLGGASTSYSDTGVAVGSYDYEVTPRVAGSTAAPALCAIDVLAPVSFTSCFAIGSTATLTWSNGALYSALEVRRNGSLVATLAGSATTYSEAVTPGTYLYALTGISGNSQASADCEIIDPGAPSSLNCVVIGDSAVLTWLNGGSYTAVRILLDGLEVQTLTGRLTTTTVPGLTSGAHTLCVIGVLGVSDSNPACCDVVLPLAVSNFSCAGDGAVVELAWTNSEPYTSLRIFRDGNLIATLPGSLQTFVDTNATLGDHIYGVSPLIGAASTAPTECTARVLSEITNFTCSGVEGDVLLSFLPGEIYDGITIERNGLLIATLTGTAESYLDTGLSAGLYQYRLVGSLTVNHTASTTCAANLPLAPTGLSCALSDGTVVELDWQNTQLGTAIEVLRDGAVVATLPGSASTYSAAGETPGSYSYCVVNVLGGNRSDFNCCVVVVPDAPTSLSCLARDGGVELAWANPENYQSITIDRDGLLVAAVPGHLTSFVDTTVASGTHNYALRGFVSGFESASTICSSPVPPTITDLVCEFNLSAVSLNWTSPTAYDFIRLYRNGLFIDELPGDSVVALDPGLSAGLYSYEVIGLIGANESAPVLCTVEVLARPIIVNCCSIGTDVELCWTNPLAYTSLSILREGVLVASVPAGTTCYVETGVSAGQYGYIIVGHIDAFVSVAATCSVRVLNPIANLICTANDCLPLTITMNWQLADTYTAVQIFRNGGMVATVPGTTTSFIDFPPDGPLDYDVIGLSFGAFCAEASAATCQPTPDYPLFVRGDVNNDGLIDVADPISALNYIFAAGVEPVCLDAADANDDGNVNIADPIWLLLYTFAGGIGPLPPFPTLGPDPTCDLLGCGL
ncbi:MAG: hypothetical protein ACKVX7_16300 [Planctomycetota bacterium]